ncbi:MAG: hypothetical protein LCH53_10510 [Bacteroidetes bacterium]|nr:hypothetical protein [Bacteroidota bacterium]
MSARPLIPTSFLNRLAWAVLLVGLLLLGFMIVVEGEPGALPLALVLLGLGGVFWARRRTA